MKTRIQFLFLGVAAALVLGTSAQAAPITVTEHSFEGGKSVGLSGAGQSTGNEPATGAPGGKSFVRLLVTPTP